MILQMLCPSQSSWSPSQQIMEIAVCNTASAAVQFPAQSGPCDASERVFAAHIQSKNALLHPVPARIKARSPFSPAAPSAPTI